LPSSERRILEALDLAVREPRARRVIDSVANRLTARLDADALLPMVWEPIPLTTYRALPTGIRSSWVFVLRARTTTGAERHPNSHQRVMSLGARADLRTWEHGGWQSHVLESDPSAPLARRWLSIPVNVWHEPVMSDAHWSVVSFHTVEAHELIEERPVGAPDEPGTRQRHYLGSNEAKASSYKP
jgi:hypothetical protein